ncbi:MAG: hypothetical protein P8Y85_05365 [Nitrospirota bacterium]|jgi:hypothetical protein
MRTSELKKLCLTNEINAAINLLKKGLAELQKIDGANDFYHLPLLLLSSGYERLIKCLLCLAVMDDQGNIKNLPFKISGREGHDLEALLNSLLSICEERRYSSTFPAAKADIDLLTDDVHLREIVVLLSEFAKGDRYYNLDIVIGRSGEKSKDPNRSWDDIEKAIIHQQPDILRRLNDLTQDIDGIYKEINRELVKVLEKFARALSRLFVYADFGDFAKQISPLVHDFLLLDDTSIGTRQYY